MKSTLLFLLSLSIFIIVQCTTHKKINQSQTSTNTSQDIIKPAETSSGTVQNAAPSVSLYPFPINKLPVFDYVPTELHLTTLMIKYPQLTAVTLSTLEQGHAIYNSGACIKCHPAKNIQAYNEVKWAQIIGDMSMRAHLSDVEKDALVKYIMAIKAGPMNNNK